MRLNFFRKIIYGALLLCVLYGTWSWLRPYEWNADPAARFKITGAQITRDETFFWLDLHLKKIGNEPHDLEKPVRLKTADGKNHEPAKTDFAGNPGEGTTELWFRFWLEKKDLEGPVSLQLNDGSLTVKSTSNFPNIGQTGVRNFISTRW